MQEKTRKTGIDAVGDVPWGTHLCQFYHTKQDLTDTLVPYFKAGLESNEFCVWVTSKPLGEREAREAMRKAVPDFAQYLERGQIEIVPHTEWYLKDGGFDGKRVLNAWIDKLSQATARGYEGMRVTGNTAWLKKRDWRSFADYEKEIDSAIGRDRILVLCTYSLDKCAASEIVDVVGSHRFSLLKHEGEWVSIESAESKKAGEMLRESETKFLKAFHSNPNPMAIATCPDALHIDVNDSFLQTFGYSRDDVIGKTSSELGLWVRPEERVRAHQILQSAGRLRDLEAKLRTKSGQVIDAVIRADAIDLGGRPCFLSVITEITERKRAEAALQESEGEYQRLFNVSLAGTYLTRLDGEILAANKAAAHFLGFDRPEDLIGRNAKAFYQNPGDRDRILQQVTRGGINRFEVELLRADGSPYTALVSNLMTELQGETAILTSVVDITERKQAEERLKIRSGGVLPKLSNQRPVTRIQDRFLRSGFKGLNDREILKLLLTFGLPCRGCNKEVEACLQRFKTVRRFLSASPEELERAGVSQRGIFCVQLMKAIPLEVLKEKVINQPFYESAREIYDYLYYSMLDLKREIFRVLYLNSQNQIIGMDDLFKGTVDSTPVHPREIIEGAIKQGAAHLIFVHNHPSGDVTASKSDKQLTRDLVFIGAVTQIKVLDHIIIGEDKYFSFAEAGLIKKYEDDFLNIRIRRTLQVSQRRFQN